jgi:hypothetical protein
VSTNRNRVKKTTQEKVIELQGWRCALCNARWPLDLHHIVPVHHGGNDECDNLIYLCKNHHDLADSGVLPPEVLKYWRAMPDTSTPVLTNDPTVIYEITVNDILRRLLDCYEPSLVSSAYTLFERFRRAQDHRYWRMCLELVFAVVYSAMHEEEPNVAKLERLARHAAEVAEKVGEDGLAYSQYIVHHMGVVYHNCGSFDRAMAAFSAAISSPDHATARQAQMRADRSMAAVRRTATMHLKGDSHDSLDELRALLDGTPLGENGDAGTLCFGRIKLAEHMFVRGRHEDALGVLAETAEMAKGASLIYRVILLKDLAKAHLLVGNRDRGIRVFVKAHALAESAGFSDQRRKILELAADFGIDGRDLEAET